MTVLYKVTPIKSHFDPEHKMRYLARPHGREMISTDKICEMIAERSSLSKADITATLYALEELIPQLLLDNYTVSLKPLGIFSLSFKSKVEDDPAKVDHRSVTEVRMQYRPDAKLKTIVNRAVIRKRK